MKTKWLVDNEINHYGSKKSELYSTLWKCCDELRGGMDASQYKDYVLVILFVKYISDKSRSDEGFDIDIPEGCYFEDFVALKGNPNIGEEMNKKMAALAEANQLDGVLLPTLKMMLSLVRERTKLKPSVNSLQFSRMRTSILAKIELPMTIL